MPEVVSRHVVVVLIALLLAGCSNFQGTGELEYVQGDGAITMVPPAERLDPVEISGETVQEEPLDFADHRGRVVVVNVWGSWCGPCRAEMPMLVDAHAELDPEAVSFIGINIRDASTANAAAFEREMGVDYPSIYDPGSETLLKFGRHAPYSPPSTLILDREGRVAALISGEIPSKKTLLDLVADVEAEASDG